MNDLDLMDEETDVADETDAGEAGFAPQAAPSPMVGGPVPTPPPAPPQDLNAGRAMFQNPPPDAYWIPHDKPVDDGSGRRRQEAIQELFSKVPIEQATKAIEAATRLEGMLGFDADRKAGVPMMEALSKWSPKLYFNHPSAIAQLQKQANTTPHQPFAPTETMVGGQKLIQMSPNRFAFAPNQPGNLGETTQVGDQQYVRTGPRHLQAIHPAKPSLETMEQIRDINRQTVSLQKQMEKLIDPEEALALQKKIDTLRAEKMKLIKSTAKGSGQSAAMEAHRAEAEALIAKHPQIADKIRARFKEHYGIDL